MSSIASATFLPRSAVDGLRAVVRPKKSFLGRKDELPAFAARHRRGELGYDDASGSIVVAALQYLEDRRHIHLLTSSLDDLATELTNERGTTHVVLEPSHRAFASELDDARFSEAELGQYLNELYGGDDMDAGELMLSAMRFLRSVLDRLDDETIALLVIG
jgi:hypothetical protein